MKRYMIEVKYEGMHANEVFNTLQSKVLADDFVNCKYVNGYKLSTTIGTNDIEFVFKLNEVLVALCSKNIRLDLGKSSVKVFDLFDKVKQISVWQENRTQLTYTLWEYQYNKQDNE